MQVFSLWFPQQCSHPHCVAPLIPQPRSFEKPLIKKVVLLKMHLFIDIHGFMYMLCCETNIRTYSSTSNELFLTGVASSKYLKLVLLVKIYNFQTKAS